MGEIEVVVEPASTGGSIAKLQRRLAGHVRSQLGGSPGSIAAAFASGDRGGISEADEEAMRDSGLSHLLSISGLHVSAVIAATYLLAIRLLALWPWLTLRVRLSVLAAACDRSDIVIAGRYLPFSCRPKWLKARRNLLNNTGGLTIYLADERFATVAEGQGDHGWWQEKPDGFSKRMEDKSSAPEKTKTPDK